MESILEIGQQAPILVRPDEGRFVLVEGLHRFEACKALGEKTIIGVMVSAEIVHQKTVLSHSAEAERDKIARLKRLRLEKEAAARLAAASEAVMEAQSAERLREPSEKGIRNITKPIKSQDLRINTKNFVGMAPATKARRWSLLIARHDHGPSVRGVPSVNRRQ